MIDQMSFAPLDFHAGESPFRIFRIACYADGKAARPMSDVPASMQTHAETAYQAGIAERRD